MNKIPTESELEKERFMYSYLIYSLIGIIFIMILSVVSFWFVIIYPIAQMFFWLGVGVRDKKKARLFK